MSTTVRKKLPVRERLIAELAELSKRQAEFEAEKKLPNLTVGPRTTLRELGLGGPDLSWPDLAGDIDERWGVDVPKEIDPQLTIEELADILRGEAPKPKTPGNGAPRPFPKKKGGKK